MSNVRRRILRVELHMQTEEQDPYSPVCALRQRLGLLRWPTALPNPKNHSVAPYAFQVPAACLESLLPYAALSRPPVPLRWRAAHHS